jgi:hypothetical protein
MIIGDKAFLFTESQLLYVSVGALRCLGNLSFIPFSISKSVERKSREQSVHH